MREENDVRTKQHYKESEKQKKIHATDFCQKKM